MNRGRKIALSEEQIQRAEKAKEKILADYYHCPEVAVLFCKVDHVMFDNLKHIRFERSQTLGEGGSLCDFHYIKQ